MNEEQEKKARELLSQNQRALIERIERLALVYSPNAREIPSGAWTFWFDAAKGATLTDVNQAIASWSKTSSRMMTPADLFKLLQDKLSVKREKAKAKEVREEQAPLPANVAGIYFEGMRDALRKDIPVDAWAKCSMIKEAYGFVMNAFQRQSWRKALGKAGDYAFADTNGVFPLAEMPDERRSFYHDCHLAFIREYVDRHGYKLVFDKELATKRYSSKPLRYDGHGNAVRGEQA